MRKKDHKLTTKSLFFLITYGILLFVALQHIGVIRSIFSYFIAILNPVISGVCIAFVINLFLKLFREKVFAGMARSEKTWVQKLCPVMCVLCTALVAIDVLAAVIVLVIPQVTGAINLLIEKMPDSTEQIFSMIDAKLTEWNAPAFFSEKLHELDMDWETFVAFVTNLLDGKVTTVLGTAVSATRTMLSGITNFVLGFIIAIYILLNKKRVLFVVHKVIELIVPDQYEPQVFRVLRLTNTAFANFLTGQIVEALVIGILSTLGLLIFGFPYAITIGVLTGITTLLPIIGAWIGGAVGLLLVWVDSPEKAVWFFIFIIILQQLDGQFIYPKIVGDSIGLPGLLVLVAVVIGGGFAGILGIVLAIPIFTIGYALLKDAIDNMQLRKAAEAAAQAGDESPETAEDTPEPVRTDKPEE